MQAQARPSPSKLLAGVVALAGVLLPMLAIAFVEENDFLRDTPFNPLPNALYLLMVATVPVANAFTAMALWQGETQVPRPVAWLHTFSIGVTLAFTLHLAPLMPLALLLVFGVGILLLSPVLALAAAMYCRRRLQHMPPLWAGLAMALLAVVLADASAISTRIGLKMALSASPAVQASGRYLLRHASSDEVWKWTCESDLTSQLGAPGAFALNLIMPVTKEQARKVYYDVKGERYYWAP